MNVEMPPGGPVIVSFNDEEMILALLRYSAIKVRQGDSVSLSMDDRDGAWTMRLRIEHLVGPCA
jgi:hypothetical protein